MVINGGIINFLFYRFFSMPKEPPETGTGHFHTIFGSKVTANLTFQGKTGKKKGEMGQNRQKSTKIWRKKMKILKKSEK